MKIIQPVILPATWVYSEWQKNYNLGHTRYDNTMDKSREQRRGTLLGRKKEEAGEDSFEGMSIGGKLEFSVVTVSLCLSYGIFSLARLLLD